jgi:NAD(P)-dependent dehydrogenase (short-subunit alcohol dehydrogenase family)
MDLTGKVAFVTSASGGLGRVIAEHLAQAGARIAIGYRTGRDRAEATAETVTAAGVATTLVAFDQFDPASIDDAVGAVVRDLGSLDILVNNAAVAKGVPFPDLEGLTPEI